MNQANVLTDFILVNYNAGDKIIDTIKSIYRYTKSQPFRITIVDNDSSDNSSQKAESLYPEVQVIYTGKNNGFGKACNIGVANTSAPYIILLNPDAKLMCDVLQEFLRYISEHATEPAPILGGLSLDENNDAKYAYEAFPTRLRLLAKALGLGFLIEPHYHSAEPHEVDSVSGSLLFIERKVFDKLGGFDESFFLYFEETDLQYRAKQVGIKSIHLPSAIYYHEIGGTFSGTSFREKCYRDGMELYLTKHYPYSGKLIHRIYYVIHKLLRPLKNALRKR